MGMKTVIRKPDSGAFPAFVRSTLAAFIFAVLAAASMAGQVPSPRSVLGFHPTDDKVIADWWQITDYFLKLDKASNRVTVREIGVTTNGRPMIAAFISSESN